MPGKKLNIAIMSFGTRGDIQPYIAIGKGLEKAGHTVKIFTCRNHTEIVEEMGLPICPCFQDSEVSLNKPDCIKAMATADVRSFMKVLNEDALATFEDVIKKFIQGIKEYGPDLVIVGTLTEYYGALVKLRLQLPSIHVKLQMIHPNPKRMLWGLPNLPCGLNGKLMQKVVFEPMWKNWADGYDPILEKFVGYKVCDVYTKEQFLSDAACVDTTPVIIGQSKATAEILYPGVPSGAAFVGPFVVPANTQLQQANQESSDFGGNAIMKELQAFIDAGSKPVYMGWGSMMCRSPEFMVELVTRALQQSGQRAIILGGWAGLSMDMLKAATTDQALVDYVSKNVLFVRAAPHEWLFPKCACTVTHAGSGTISSALRAGVPTVVTPVWLDQVDHAYLVEQLGVGVGFSKQFQKIRAGELASAISKCVSDKEIAANAKEVGAKMSAEDGVGAVVSAVEAFWTQWVENGKYAKHVKAMLQPKQAPQSGAFYSSCWFPALAAIKKLQ